MSAHFSNDRRQMTLCQRPTQGDWISTTATKSLFIMLAFEKSDLLAHSHIKFRVTSHIGERATS